MPRGTAADRESLRPERQVNALLHTLRGEQFRHQQNLRRSTTPTSTSLQAKPTLPLAQIFGTRSANDLTVDAYAETLEPVQPAPFREPGTRGHMRGMRPPVTLVEGVPTYAYPNGPVPGPRPPRSWTPLFDEDRRQDPQWRAKALSLLFKDLHVPSWICDVGEEDQKETVPPLTLECARAVLEICRGSEDWAEVAAYIPAHVKRDLVRWYALRSPLGTATLQGLFGEESHVAGELLVVGPEASLKRSMLNKGEQVHRYTQSSVQPTAGEGSSWDETDTWDAPGDAPASFTTLALVMTPLPNEFLVYLPPTLTHIALVALPHPARVYRLPELCPLLEVLDLSYNDWISNLSSTAEGSLTRVPWRRWRYLRVLGLRGCGVGGDIVAKVNAERWTDVEVVGLEEPAPIVGSNRVS